MCWMSLSSKFSAHKCALHNLTQLSSTKSFSEKLGRFWAAESQCVSELAAIELPIHLRTGASVVLWRHAT